MSKISAVIKFKQNPMTSYFGKNESEKTGSPYYYNLTRASEDRKKESELLPNTLKVNTKIAIHKAANVLSEYAKNGFTGDKNASFYQQLTMSGFPYITGGLTIIALFNAASKYFNLRDEAHSRKIGLGMALGVIFYGIAKELSKKLISNPVRLATGIDLDKPYKKVVDLIPKSPEDAMRRKTIKDGMEKDNNTAFEYHKAFESVDFPRTDLFYETDKGKNRNKYYDEIAKKNGFGTNLNDSDQEVRPFIKEVVVKSKTAQTLSQYLWAAVGVGIGVQEPWSELLDIGSFKYSGSSLSRYIMDYARSIKESFMDSCESFVNGGLDNAINKKARYAGRTLLGLAALVTVLGTINAVRNPYMKNTKAMNETNIFNDASKVVED